VPDWVKSSFVIFDIWHSDAPALSVRVPGCQKVQMSGLTRSGTRWLIALPYMATVCVKGLISHQQYGTSVGLTGLSRCSCGCVPPVVCWSVVSACGCCCAACDHASFDFCQQQHRL